MISGSIDKVETGAIQVDQAGATMAEIVNAVNASMTSCPMIADASNEQSVGIEEVNKAIIQMEGVTQQNAALVEEAAAAEMQERANGLYAAISVFKLDGSREDVRSASPAIALSASASAVQSRKECKPPKARVDDEKHLSVHLKDGEWKSFDLA